MHIQDHINVTIPVFEPEDSLKEVILFFAHSTHSHVAVAEGGRFLGLLGEADLESFQETGTIEDYRYQLESFLVAPEATSRMRTASPVMRLTYTANSLAASLSGTGASGTMHTTALFTANTGERSAMSPSPAPLP